MIKKILFVILVLFFTSSSVYAQNFQFENKSDKILIYHLDWVSHPYKFPEAFHTTGGELEPGKIKVFANCSPGVWEIEWFSPSYVLDNKVDLVEVMDTTGFDKIIIQCDGKKIFILKRKL